MSYESDNPQFDHLINNLDSDEVPRKSAAIPIHIRHPDTSFCVQCGMKMRETDRGRRCPS